MIEAVLHRRTWVQHKKKMLSQQTEDKNSTIKKEKVQNQPLSQMCSRNICFNLVHTTEHEQNREQI